jgi:alcohol dehydrogenase
VFDEVAGNPTTRHVARGLSAAEEFGPDCIVGLGGGSSMDCAKGINFLYTNGGRMEDYWGTGKASRPMLVSLGVPTTAGTGSEAQSYALISQEGTGKKMACGDPKARFVAVILDPRLLPTAPREVREVSAIDALSHAVESYVSTRRNPVSALFAREAWRLLGSALERSLADADDLRAGGDMLLGAHLAGLAIEHSMLGAAHACANPLTARFGVPHGVAVGLLLPHVVAFNRPAVAELYAELERTDGATIPPATLEQRLRALCAACRLPERLADCGVPRSALEALADEAAEQWTAAFNPRRVTRRELRDLYDAAY